MKLGRIAARSDRRTLNLEDFRKVQKAIVVPQATNFWTKRAPFKPESWGNREYGCCTIAKQANMFRRFERLEQRKTITITREAVLDCYERMSNDLYGGGDNGAYEEDALGRSRKPETAIKDNKGRPLLIDAYLRVDSWNHDAVREAIYTTKGHGIAVCLNLPQAYNNIVPPSSWDVPRDWSGKPLALTGAWRPGSWGGHSMWAIDYNKFGIVLEQTWDVPINLVTWEAAAAYMDEVHIVLDSKNAWKRLAKNFDVADIKDQINSVSSTKVRLAA